MIKNISLIVLAIGFIAVEFDAVYWGKSYDNCNSQLEIEFQNIQTLSRRMTV